MDEQDFFKIIGFIVFGMFLVYYVVKCLHLQASMIEGLTNEGDAKPDTVTPSNPPSGSGGNAKKYADAIKSLTVKMQDELLIGKYRKDYENAIINLDDFVSILMLKQVLSLKPNDGNPKANIDILASLNVLKNSKDALNSVMTFVDKQ
jgi:hypothetical protein